MDAISDLPMLHDIDADYSPQYVKLARIIRDKIESGRSRSRRRPGTRAQDLDAGRLGRAGNARREQVSRPPYLFQALPRDLGRHAGPRATEPSRCKPALSWGSR
jgi:hypothetical protein